MAIAMLTDGIALIPALALAFPTDVLSLVALSALGETAYAVALSRSYARGDLSVAYPIGRGTSPLLVTLAGIAVLHQAPTPAAVAGAVALAAGVLVLDRSCSKIYCGHEAPPTTVVTAWAMPFIFVLDP
jgi:multidrug transporter EmrE-like cation transporter